MNRYTDEQRTEALIRLELNAGNLKRTAREIGVPPPTLRMWRDGMLAAGTTMHLSPAAPEKTDFAALWAKVQVVATTRLLELLPRADTIRDVATAGGIAADKHLDYTQGRKGSQVTVDARSQHLTIEGITDAERRDLIARTLADLG